MKIVIWLFYFIAVYCEYNIILIIDKKIAICQEQRNAQKLVILLKTKSFLKTFIIVFGFLFGFTVSFL